jgi:hypothetical protein
MGVRAIANRFLSSQRSNLDRSAVNLAQKRRVVRIRPFPEDSAPSALLRPVESAIFLSASSVNVPAGSAQERSHRPGVSKSPRALFLPQIHRT